MEILHAITGVIFCGLYGWYKIDSKKDKVKDLYDRFNVKALVFSIYNREKNSHDVINSIVKSGFGKQAEKIFFLQDLFARLYGFYGITSAGFFVAENNLSEKLEGLCVQSLCMSQTLEYFCIGTDKGKFVYFKNEFYNDPETGKTSCIAVAIDDEQSAIVGIGYQQNSEIITVVYRDGIVRYLDVNQKTRILPALRFELKKTFIDVFVAPVNSVFVTIDNNCMQEMWMYTNSEVVKNLSSFSFAHLVAADAKIYLDTAVYIEAGVKNLLLYLAINNMVDQKVEIYSYTDSGYVLVCDIPYDGKIICSDFFIEQHFFALYIKGGKQDGLHVWDLRLKKPGAYFSPEAKQHQHPVKITMVNDKIFCLYQNGIMDMWHCEADRIATAQNALEIIMQPLSYGSKLEFLQSFAEYLHERTSKNYKIMHQIALQGGNKCDVETALFMLQILPPEMLEKLHEIVKTL